MSTSDPLIGKRLGDYLIEGVLGTGGMARVYRGYDDNLDRYAAIKVIEPQLIASAEEDEYRERFLREARAIARLNHSYIVGVYQFNQVGNLYYIAMEYVDGRNLRDILKSYIRQDKLMPTSELLAVLQDIADALDYAHGQNIIHRDVKPSNVIVKENGHAVLTDFGLALNAMEGTIGNTFGSVHYIAPEQAISSAQAVPQSDQYSLGIVAYELLTGRVPFDDASAMSVALKHISDPPPPPTDLNPNIPAEVEQVILKALDKDVAKRYDSSKAFVAALELAFSMVDNQDVAPPPEFPVKTPPPTPEGLAVNSQKALSEWDDAKVTKTVQAVDEKQRTGTHSILVPPEPASAFNRGLLIGISVALLIIIIFMGLIATGALNGLLGINQATETAVANANLEETQNALHITETHVAQQAVAAQATADARSSATQQALVASTAEATENTDEPLPTEDTVAVATDDVDPTATHTNTPSPTATATNTNTPSPTATNTNTPSPTATNTNTPSPTATDTATNTPTATYTPSRTPTPTNTPTPSLALDADNGDTAQVLLRYDGRMLIIGNRDVQTINVRSLVFVLFERNDDGIMEEGQPYRVRSASFASEAQRLLATRCLQLLDSTQFSSPPSEMPLAEDLCGRSPFWTTTFRPFWISNTRDAYFEVRLGDVDVLARCPTQRRLTRTEQRCVVDLDALP